MKTSTMRRADATFGRAACGILTVARRARREPDASGPIERIVLVKLAEQGATVVAYDALVRAVDLVGREQVHLVVFAENRPIVDVLGLVPTENVHTIRTSSAGRGAIDLVRTVRRLRRVGVDAGVDLESFSRLSAALVYLSGARRRVGLHRYHGSGFRRGDLMTHRVAPNARWHAAEGFDALVAALTVAPDRLPALDVAPRRPEPLPPFEPDPAEERAMAQRLRQAFGLPDLPRLILLNANAGDMLPLRRWPEDRYRELALALLARRSDVGLVLTGGPGEATAVDRLAAEVGSPRCVSMAGRTTFRELLVLYGLADVLVTNDSGPAHYAALTPVDVVVLFGPESPDVFGSRSPRSHPLSARLPCSPCINVFNARQSACTDNVCMQRITVADVEEQVVDVLERRPAPQARW